MLKLLGQHVKVTTGVCKAYITRTLKNYGLLDKSFYSLGF